jgi:hypothetical protein
LVGKDIGGGVGLESSKLGLHMIEIDVLVDQHACSIDRKQDGQDGESVSMLEENRSAGARFVAPGHHLHDHLLELSHCSVGKVVATTTTAAAAAVMFVHVDNAIIGEHYFVTEGLSHNHSRLNTF